jgi:hypothetical protein
VLLALDQQLVDDRAAVVDGDVADQATRPVSVSTSATAMCAPKGNVASSCSNRASPASGPSSSSIAREASSAHDSARAGTPCTPIVPVDGVDHDVGLVGLEQPGGEGPGRVHERLRGLVDRRAAELHRAGAAGAATVRDAIGVAVDERDVLHGMPVWSLTSMA